MKYYLPSRIEKLNNELNLAYEDFEFLITCKEVGQPCGKHLDPLLEDELVHLADTCIKFNELFDSYIKAERQK